MQSATTNCPHGKDKFCWHYVKEHGVGGRCGIKGEDIPKLKRCALLDVKRRKKRK